MANKKLLYSSVLVLLFMPILSKAQDIRQDTFIERLTNEHQHEMPYFIFGTPKGWGVMDTLKKVILPIINASGPEGIETHNGLLLRYQQENKIGLINLTYFYRLPLVYDAIKIRNNMSSHESVCSAGIIKQGSKHGAIDLKIGKVIIDCIYDTIHIKCDNFIVVKDNKKGLYSYRAGELLPCLYDEIYRHSGTWIFKKGDKLGYIHCNLWDTTPQVKTELLYDKIEGYDDIILAQKNGKWGMLNIRNKTQIPFEYDFFEKKHIGFFCGTENTDCSEPESYYIPAPHIVTKNKKFGLIDAQNHQLLPFVYDEFLGRKQTDFYTEISFIKQTNKKADTCKLLLPHQMDKKKYFYHLEYADLFKKWAFMDTLNRQLTPFRFDDVRWDYTPQPTVIENGKYGVFDIRKNKYIIPAIYNAIHRFKESDLIWVQKEGKLGIINHDGKEILPIEYDEIQFSDAQDYYAPLRLTKNGLSRLVKIRR